MRLGAYFYEIKSYTRAQHAYQKSQISECYRYEFNNNYKEIMEEKGFNISGVLKNENLYEIAEINNHP